MSIDKTFLVFLFHFPFRREVWGGGEIAVLTVLRESVSLLEHIPEGTGLGRDQHILIPCEVVGTGAVVRTNRGSTKKKKKKRGSPRKFRTPPAHAPGGGGGGKATRPTNHPNTPTRTAGFAYTKNKQ